MDTKKFSRLLSDRLGPDMVKFPEVFKAVYDVGLMEDMIAEISAVEENGDGGITVPDEWKDFTLNANLASRRPEDDFFVTTPEEFIAAVTGRQFMWKCGITPGEARGLARGVMPEYRPRSDNGVVEEIEPQTKETLQIFNTYIPPEWKIWKKKNPEKWRDLPSSPPLLFTKLVRHLIPDKDERAYLYSWMASSMEARAYVYLVLSGAPGSGKNRLKLVMRALHGGRNTIDGKKSTLTERFNSQMSEGTLAWFDELRYNADMENVMKELQNDYLSIERKGVDATKSTKIYASMAISNNKPRDNYIAFDARKFAPLKIGLRDLRHSMTEKEIDTLTRKVDVGSPDYDVEFVAQIAKWVLRTGKRHLSRWPNLEYRGPMFWTLAHTSMTRWQKKSVSAIVDKKPIAKFAWDAKEGAYLWSRLEEKLTKKGADSEKFFPDYSSVQAFFDIFRDGEGRKPFETKLVPGDNILGDFWIYPKLNDVKIITEAKVAQEREKGRQDDEKEKFDL